jgi:hypothetical protein
MLRSRHKSFTHADLHPTRLHLTLTPDASSSLPNSCTSLQALSSGTDSACTDPRFPERHDDRVYLAVAQRGRRHVMQRSAEAKCSAGRYAALCKPWPTGVGAIALVVTNVFMFMYALALGVFPQISMWGANLYTHLGLKTASPFSVYPVKPILLDMHSLIDVGIIAGALTAAMLTTEWKVRREDWRVVR